MWQEYMRDLLGWKDPSPVTKKSKRPKESESNSSQIINVGDEQFRMRICRADYHGAFIKITKSKCPSQLGVQVIYIYPNYWNNNPTSSFGKWESGTC